MAVAHLPLMLQERLPALIAAIYESALDPARWQGFLALLGAALRSPASVIWANDFAQRTVDLDGGRHFRRQSGLCRRRTGKLCHALLSVQCLAAGPEPA